MIEPRAYMNKIPSRKPLVISEEVPEVIKVAIWEKDHLLFLEMRFMLVRQ